MSTNRLDPEPVRKAGRLTRASASWLARDLRRRLTLLCALLVVSAPLAGCSDADDDPEPSGRATISNPAVQVRKALRSRARALLERDEPGFLATADPQDPGFLARERVYFANLAQLPLAELRYRVKPDDVVATSGGIEAVAQLSMQIEGYDAAPVVRPVKFHFAQAAGPKGQPALLVTADQDKAWQARNDIDVPPWETGPIRVVTGDGVLAVFDDTSVASAGEVVGHVEAGIADVRTDVPLPWDGRVIVYAFSDTEILDQITDLPGEDPDALDAVSFPVYSHTSGGALASTRFLLHPRMLQSDQERLARLVRHELVHVALGDADDDVPVWLAEGVAEWVSVRRLPPHRRLISQEAIDEAIALAERGKAGLPTDTEFNDADQAAHYGLAWWAVQSIADEHGPATVWDLLARLANTPPEDEAAMIEATLGMTEETIARTAARRIVATYG